MCWFVQQKGLNWQKCPDSDLLLHLCFCCLRPPQVHPGGPGPAHEVTGGSEGAGVASAQRPAGIGRWHHRIRDSPGGSQGGDMTSPAPPDKGLRIAPKHKPGPAPLPCLPRPAPSRRLAPPRPHAPMPQTHTPACHGAQKTPFSYGRLRCERRSRHLPEPRPFIVTLFMLQALDDDIIGRSSIRARHFCDSHLLPTTRELGAHQRLCQTSSLFPWNPTQRVPPLCTSQHALQVPLH